MSTEIDETTSSVRVTIRPNHVIRGHSVEIAIQSDDPQEVCYHLISPARALAFLAQLEQERATLEQMLKDKAHEQ